MSLQQQQDNECLSAFLDAEQSDSETSRIVDALLKEPEYKEQYSRLHLMHDHLHDQVQLNSSETGLRHNVSLALDDLPGHFVEDAVVLQSVQTEDVSQTHWFNRFIDNRLLSGVSMAASVMFMTLFILQGFNHDSNSSNSMTDNSLAATSLINSSSNSQSLIKSVPPIMQPPASYVSAKASKPQYEWVEADPVLSQQVRQYVSEHEKHRAAYNLQPKIRTAAYSE